MTTIKRQKRLFYSVLHKLILEKVSKCVKDFADCKTFYLRLSLASTSCGLSSISLIRKLICLSSWMPVTAWDIRAFSDGLMGTFLSVDGYKSTELIWLVGDNNGGEHSVWKDLKYAEVWSSLNENDSGRYKEYAIRISEWIWKWVTEYGWKGAMIVWVECKIGREASEFHVIQDLQFTCFAPASKFSSPWLSNSFLASFRNFSSNLTWDISSQHPQPMGVTY